jgi:hypothetical protein
MARGTTCTARRYRQRAKSKAKPKRENTESIPVAATIDGEAIKDVSAIPVALAETNALQATHSPPTATQANVEPRPYHETAVKDSRPTAPTNGNHGAAVWFSGGGASSYPLERTK